MKKVFKMLAVILVASIIVSMNISFDTSGNGHFIQLGGNEAWGEFNPTVDISPITAGDGHTLALMNDGTAKSWGFNGTGELGLGDTANRSIPATIPGLMGVKQLAVGFAYSLALMNDGTAKAWGYNGRGQLGLGDTENRSTPATIPGLMGVKQLVAGDGHTLALMNDGTVKAWGYNETGQLGLGDTLYRSTPFTIPGLTGVKQLTTGSYYTLALMDDGTVKAWGDNKDGGLGLGDTADRNIPVVIPGLTGVKQLVAGHRHTLALMNDGTVKAWGNNAQGQLGLGDTIERNTPVTIPGLTGVKQLVAGDVHTLALMNDETVKAWGYNRDGILGLGDTVDRNTPVAIPGLAGVIHLVARSNHTFALMYDGTVKAWGENNFGQLGLGDTTNRNTPNTIPGIIHNIQPNISVILPTQNETFSESDTAFKPTITVSDADNDSLTCKYYIDTETTPRGTEIVTDTTTAKSVTFTNGTNMSTLTEGNHTLRCEVSDGKADPVSHTINIRVDKSAPILGTITASSSYNSITLSGSATDNIAGLDPYPFRYTINSTPTGWLTATSNTWNSLTPSTQYSLTFEARDAKGHITACNKNVYTKAQVPSIAVNNARSYSLDITVNDSNPINTQYQVGVNSGTRYVTSEGTLTSGATWITFPAGKKLTVTGLSPSTSYTFAVKARNTENIETTTSTASGTTLVPPPAPPFNVVATSTNSTINVSWENVSSATSGYDIEVDGIIVDVGTNTSYTHSNLTQNTQHTYRVRAKGDGGLGNWSSVISKSTLPNIPSVPLNILAAASGTTVTIVWDSVGGATGYDIEVDGTVINVGPTTNYVHRGLTPGTNHSYRVRSVNPAGKSDWSNEADATVPLNPPAVPANITTTPSRDKVVITWDPVQDVTYDIEVDGTVMENSSSTTYTHIGLSASSQHTYRVRSKKAGSIGDWSASATVTTLPDVFGVPTNIKTSVANTSVSLIWDAVVNATGYDVEADGVIIENGTSTACTVNGLEPNTQHTYMIRAKNDTQTSEWSTAITVTTAVLDTPANLNATSTETTITINWSAITGADKYDLEVDGTVVQDITATSYICRNLPANTQRTFRLRAKSDIGTSSWSAPFTKATQFSGQNIPSRITSISRNTSITVIWSGVDGSTGYDLEVDGTIVPDLTNTNYVYTGLTAGTQHTYRVRAKNSSGTSSWSNMMTVSTLPVAPATPTNVVSSSTSTSILITWDEVQDAASYDIEVDGVIVSIGTGTTYLYNGLNPGTQHTYRVRTVNISGTSQWSPLETTSTKGSTENYTVSCSNNEVFSIELNASDIDTPAGYVFTITYNPDQLDVVDLCAFTSKADLMAGNVAGTDIKVTQFVPGTIVFTKSGALEPGQTWTGFVNSIKFRSKINGQTNLTYSIQ